MHLYNEQAQNIQKHEKKSEVILKLRSLKFEFMEKFCVDMIKSFDVLSLRLQYAEILNVFRQDIKHLPSQLPFTYGTCSFDSLFFFKSNFESFFREPVYTRRVSAEYSKFGKVK
jgi:hypothetical protein